ncbi:ISL3 family transposase [Methylobacterium oryzisoli]|uniref:ISL3 family transposase n=1 Tax=Methylobacterium oryzisoli TaxID=3385502 RepID=UPI003892B93B
MPRRLLPLVPPQLSVVGIEPTPDHLVIHVRLRPRPTCCPGCRGLDCRPHGSYHRTSADLPWQGRPVSLRLRVRRFRCTNPACPRRTFSEQGGDVVQPHARRSVRLHDLQRHLGLALGGEPAARLAQRLAMPVSGDTLLRLVRAGALPTHPEPRVVGVDEWAWRRGRSYGTVFVDLERHTVLDLLPDRATESVAAWLHGHPDIAVVARDRAEVFAEGTRVGAPQARQVLDRFHLLRNLSAALRAIAVDHHAAIRAAGRALLDQEVEAARTRSRAARTPTASEIRKRATHAPRQARHAELKRLAEGGASVSGMARALGLDRKTVRVWLARDAPPSWRRRRVVPTILDPYRADLEARWQAGCHNAAELARALIRAGADVRPRVVRDWAMKRRREAMDVLDAVPGSPSTPRWRPPSAERTARLLQADPSTLGEIDRRFVEGLRAEAPALVESAVLAIRFADLVRRRSCESVEAWLAAASATPLASFAAGLQHDVEALRGTTTTPWSTGPVEGQIGRLKMLKRMMFGRAGFALLRQRVLTRF